MIKIIAGLLIFLGAATVAQARLGETPSEVTARFGTPINSTTIQSGDDAGLRLLQFSKQGFTILVYFKHVSIDEDYDAQRLTQKQIQALLAANSEDYFWKEKRTSTGRAWVRDDGATAHLIDSEIEFKSKVLIKKQARFTKAQQPSIDGF